MLSPALKSFHDAVYVLTIPSNTQRQQNAREELGADNFEFVDGIDKRTYTKERLIREGIYDEELAKQLDPKSRIMTAGHICCAYGHRMIYERILGSESERVLIFEDDVVTLPFTDDEMSSATSNIPADAEVILWGWLGGRYRPPFGALQQLIFHAKHTLGFYKYDHRMIRNLYMRRWNKYFDVSAINFGTYAYTVSRSAAEKLFRLNTPIAMNSDHATIHAALTEEIKMYVSRKQFFGNRSFDPNDPVESLNQKYY